jgi:putative peptidoglycan lipid II flippase
MMLVGLPLARLIFEYRQFTLDDAQRVAVVLIGYSAGIWAYSLMHVLTRAYYALQDTRTPLRIALSMMVVNLLLNLAGIWVLGVAALAWSTSITATLQIVLLLRGLRRQVPAPVDRAVRRSWTRSAMLTLLMGAATAAWLLWQPAAQLNRGASAALLAAMLVTGAAVYGTGSLLTHSRELRGLLNLRASKR